MKLIDLTKRVKQVVIIGHVRPDGDCFGSGLALKRILENAGKVVDFCIDSELPAHYSFMDGFETVNQRKCKYYDMAISVDCADELRLGCYYSIFKSCPFSVNIDHHVTNTKFAKHNYIFDVSSTCELLYNEFIKDNIKIDRTIAQNLYVGLSTDTGHFKHSNTTPQTMQVGAQLLAYGINAQYVLDKLYRNNTVNKMKLVNLAMSGIRYFKNDRIAIVTITKQALESCGCTMADTEAIIDYPMSIGCVEVAVCMTQQNVHSYKVSFRSKSVNVAAAASVFGGGGHVLAAGCVVNGYYEDCVDKILKSITDGMKDE